MSISQYMFFLCSVQLAAHTLAPVLVSLVIKLIHVDKVPGGRDLKGTKANPKNVSLGNLLGSV